MHSGKYRNQSHKFQTPEIPWKPQLWGKPANKGFISASANPKNDYNNAKPGNSSTEKILLGC
jgi:hypothetical protein